MNKIMFIWLERLEFKYVEKVHGYEYLRQKDCTYVFGNYIFYKSVINIKDKFILENMLTGDIIYRCDVNNYELMIEKLKIYFNFQLRKWKIKNLVC